MSADDDKKLDPIIEARIVRAKAAAWDECAAAATGGGLTPLAEMLRSDNPYRVGDPR